MHSNLTSKVPNLVEIVHLTVKKQLTASRSRQLGSVVNHFVGVSKNLRARFPEILYPPLNPTFGMSLTQGKRVISTPGLKLALSPGPIPSFSMLHAELTILKRVLGQGYSIFTCPRHSCLTACLLFSLALTIDHAEKGRTCMNAGIPAGS